MGAQEMCVEQINGWTGLASMSITSFPDGLLSLLQESRMNNQEPHLCSSTRILTIKVLQEAQ